MLLSISSLAFDLRPPAAFVSKQIYSDFSRDNLFSTFSLNKKSMVERFRTLDFQANAHEACINPQDHGVLATRISLTNTER